jgi:hypothetical protein
MLFLCLARVAGFKDILGHEKEPDLRRSCEYALGELEAA